jgi:hypothetical protein
MALLDHERGRMPCHQGCVVGAVKGFEVGGDQHHLGVARRTVGLEKVAGGFLHSIKDGMASLGCGLAWGHFEIGAENGVDDQIVRSRSDLRVHSRNPLNHMVHLDTAVIYSFL